MNFSSHLNFDMCTISTRDYKKVAFPSIHFCIQYRFDAVFNIVLMQGNLDLRSSLIGSGVLAHKALVLLWYVDNIGNGRFRLVYTVKAFVK